MIPSAGEYFQSREGLCTHLSDAHRSHRGRITDGSLFGRFRHFNHPDNECFTFDSRVAGRVEETSLRREKYRHLLRNLQAEAVGESTLLGQTL
jgi:hypothetical protein